MWSQMLPRRTPFSNARPDLHQTTVLHNGIGWGRQVIDGGGAAWLGQRRLGQAHWSTHDLERHPVAGVFVRVGKTLLDVAETRFEDFA